ncbi:MAG TPA: ABC transporter ATP-binding protein [Chloroflexia bacterium]|nr:ABC transporter ATP-binding protein [Chloroflexia bacterium]
MPPLLEVKDLKTQFFTQDGVVNAVNGVSFDLYEEETLGIVGESGSGKSVTALSIMGLIPQPPGKITGGQVLFKGRDLVNLPDEEMRKIRGKEIAMIFQDPMTSLNPVLKISRQIGESLQLHMGMDNAAARKRTIDLLKLVGIPSAADRIDDYPHQFSGGMRQRVMIAMALSCNPKLLIADEPTTALDVTIQAQILELIKRLKREFGTAVMMITHDLGVVAGMCDRVQVMYAGHLVEQAGVQQLYADPRHPYTFGLIRSVPRLDEARRDRLEPIPGLPPDLVNVPPGCPFYPRCSFHMPVCLEQRPLLRPVDEAHNAACWADIKEAVTNYVK